MHNVKWTFYVILLRIFHYSGIFVVSFINNVIIALLEHAPPWVDSSYDPFIVNISTVFLYLRSMSPPRRWTLVADIFDNVSRTSFEHGGRCMHLGHVNSIRRSTVCCLVYLLIFE